MDNENTEAEDHVAVGIGVVGGTPIGESARAAEDAAPDRADSAAEESPDNDDDVSTILAQVRGDAADASRDEVERVLRERLAKAGVEKSDDEIAELADQVTTGDA